MSSDACTPSLSTSQQQIPKQSLQSQQQYLLDSPENSEMASSWLVTPERAQRSSGNASRADSLQAG